MLMRRSRFGIALRAAAADPSTASTMGIDVRNVYAVTRTRRRARGNRRSDRRHRAVVHADFGPGLPDDRVHGGGAGRAGVGVGHAGGRNAGRTLAQAIGGALFGPVYQLLTVYLLFIALLALRPQGLFGGPAS